MDKIKEYAKAAGAFLVAVIGNMIISLVNGTSPWPTTQEEWVRYAVTSFGAAIGALIPRNKVTEKQVTKAITKGDVTPAVVSIIAETTPAPTTPVVVLPASEQPTVVAHPIQAEPPLPTSSGSVVDDIIAGYQGKHRAK